MKEVYSVEGVEHEVTEKYDLEYFANGGEHIVMEVDGHPEVVAKVDIFSIRDAVKIAHTFGESLEQISEEMRRKFDRYVSKEKVRYQTLKDVFGTEHVPKIKKFFMKVPVTPKIIKEIFKPDLAIKYFGDKEEDYPKELDAVVSIQQKVEGSQDVNTRYVLSGYAEKTEDIFESDYIHQTEELVFGIDRVEEKDSEYGKGGKDSDNKKGDKDFDKESFLRAQHVPYIRYLFEEINRKPMLFDAVADFLIKTVEYVNTSGEILDIVGRGNVAFIPGRDEYKYYLIDALYPHKELTIEHLKKAFESFGEKGDSISNSEKCDIYNGLNFVRTINGLAAYMKLDTRITQFEGMEVNCRDLLRMLQDRYKAPIQNPVQKP